MNAAVWIIVALLAAAGLIIAAVTWALAEAERATEEEL